MRREFAIFGAVLVLIAGGLGLFQGLKYQSFLASMWKIPTAEVSIYKTDYWMGELVQSIVEKGEYRGCYPDPRSAQPATVGLCFSTHRMPFVTFFLVAVAEVFNNVVFMLALKTALAMAVLCTAMWMIASHFRDWRPTSIGLAAIYLFNPANVLVLLGPVTEESMLIPQMGLAGALLFATRSMPARLPAWRLVCLAVLVALMPMTKTSALLPAAAIAVLVALFARSGRWLALAPLAALAATLLAWGFFTYEKTGHFAFGGSLSSLNGYNLHHGYTPYFGEVAPRYNLDLPVSRGQIKLEAPVRDEWEFNAQFTSRAEAFIREHPAKSAWYLVIKTYMALFKLTPEYQPYNGEDGFFLPKHLFLTLGIVVDRVILWLGLGTALVMCWQAVRTKGWRSLLHDRNAFAGTTLLAVSLTFLAPFTIAFSNFRHLTPLYYFVVAYVATFPLRRPVLNASWAHGLRRRFGSLATHRGV
jgi:hypothetical protein